MLGGVECWNDPWNYVVRGSASVRFTRGKLIQSEGPDKAWFKKTPKKIETEDLCTLLRGVGPSPTGGWEDLEGWVLEEQPVGSEPEQRSVIGLP